MLHAAPERAFAVSRSYCSGQHRERGSYLAAPAGTDGFLVKIDLGTSGDGGSESRTTGPLSKVVKAASSAARIIQQTAPFWTSVQTVSTVNTGPALPIGAAGARAIHTWWRPSVYEDSTASPRTKFCRMPSAAPRPKPARSSWLISVPMQAVGRSTAVIMEAGSP